jgi:hypothetical protein
MWWAVPIASWNRAVSTNRIQAASSTTCWLACHLIHSGRYRLRVGRYRPHDHRWNQP